MADPPPRRARSGLFFALYLCEGAPIGFLWWTLPAILAERGTAADATGTLLALLALPWAAKFLWTPLIDAAGPRSLARWIGGAQSVMAATLAGLLVTLDADLPAGVQAALLISHALAAASQDAAIDALALRSVPEDALGRVNGWMQAGMLTGRALFGGGGLLVRRWIPDEALIAVLAGGLAASALGFQRLTLRAAGTAPPRHPGFLRHLARVAGRRTTWIALAFAATSGAGFEAVGAFASRFLGERGLAPTTIGTFLGLGAVGAMVVGALLGGRLADRLAPRRAVLVTGLAVASSVLTLAARQDVLTGGALLTALGAVYLSLGTFTAVSYALFMRLADADLGATQFSAFMGATNACESWSVAVAGHLISARGYGLGFGVPACVGLAALALVPWLRSPSSSAAEPVESAP